jgi:hypothetical protein
VIAYHIQKARELDVKAYVAYIQGRPIAARAWRSVAALFRSKGASQTDRELDDALACVEEHIAAIPLAAERNVRRLDRLAMLFRSPDALIGKEVHLDLRRTK